MSKWHSIEHCRSVMEEKTERVKSVAFHPCKKVLIVGLHNGKIQAWNYLYKTKVFELEEHEGPVRVVVFHHLIERFASAGDDCLIRVWNYKTRSVEMVFKGHTDYIRSLEFHKHLPWILSASDDQTIRIWNFQSKKQIACLTGHTHYVMGARFLSESLFASVSLDQTIRIWDYSALTVKSQATVMDMLGVPEVLVKHIIDGHDRGINWISAKPDSCIFATGGDDSSIRLWDASTDSVFETDTLHGHHSHVSSLYFTATDILISNSEDGTLKLWDVKKRKAIKTLNIDNSRFWCIAMDPSEKVLAAGHDTGFCVYTLEKESSLFATADDYIYLQRGMEIIKTDTKTEIRVCEAKGGLKSLMARNGYILLNYGNCYSLVAPHETIRGPGKAVLGEDSLWVSTGAEVLEKTLGGVEKRTEALETDRLFLSPLGVIGARGMHIFCLDRPEEKVLLPEACRSICAGEGFIAAITEKSIVMLDMAMNQLAVIDEVLSINSAVAYGETLFYTTAMHLKFAFSSGEASALLSTEESLWVAQIKNDRFIMLNRAGVVSELEVDLIEWRFKYALEKKDSQVLRDCIEKDALIGQAPLACLIKKGAYQEAQEYVDDPAVSAELCLKTKDFKGALGHALKTGSNSLLSQVGMAAINYDLDLAEQAFKAANDIHSLILLCVAAQRVDKLDSILFDCQDEMYIALAAIITGNNERLHSLIAPHTAPDSPTIAPAPAELSSESASTLDTNQAQLPDHSESNDQSLSKSKSKESPSTPAKPLKEHQTTTPPKSNSTSTNSTSTNSSHLPNAMEDDEDATINFSSSEKQESSDLDDLLDKDLGNSDLKDKNEEEIEASFSSSKSEESEDLDTLPPRIRTLITSRLDLCLKNTPASFDTQSEIQRSLGLVTDGKFSLAIAGLLISLHSLIRLIKTGASYPTIDQDISLCSTYLQCLLAERIRKKTTSDKTAISCSIFFASAGLKTEHKEKALRAAIAFCYKKGNRHTALELARELVETMNCDDSRIKLLANSTKPMEDTFFIDTSLPFCIDKGEYLESASKCGICHAWSSKAVKVCACCFVSTLE
ncbi:coatomer subunit alpha [Nematocida homosporus]|uniref:coatomer subunit alpha n=1 Tax=Nematocida homosporus TaxID=1912981 RepID=UPI00221E8DD8|nr:coatomer subunit alpha [Nematocida homosporus]KAI5184345.1 coatomer subunit alpha [Nematocida homosporus]